MYNANIRKIPQSKNIGGVGNRKQIKSKDVKVVQLYVLIRDYLQHIRKEKPLFWRGFLLWLVKINH
jgi:hypothetical protein